MKFSSVCLWCSQYLCSFAYFNNIVDSFNSQVYNVNIIMIKYQLRCRCNHEFEGWFLDSGPFGNLNLVAVEITYQAFQRSQPEVVMVQSFQHKEERNVGRHKNRTLMLVNAPLQWSIDRLLKS